MNEQPPSPTTATAQKKLAAAYRATYAIAVLFLVIGILVSIFRESAPDGVEIAIAIAVVCFIFAALYFVLGFFIQRKSKIALGIAIGLMGANLISGVIQAVQNGSPTGLFIPILYLTQTWEGFKAIDELKRSR